MSMNSKPRSPFEQVGGMSCFARVVDKIRLFAEGKLHADFHGNLGMTMGMDGFLCAFLHVDYAELRSRVLEGGTDEEILQWCYERGGRPKPNRIERMIWNEFVRKLGWNDRATPLLEKLKSESGLADRSDIVTMLEFMEVDEGRKSAEDGEGLR